MFVGSNPEPAGTNGKGEHKGETGAANSGEREGRVQAVKGIPEAAIRGTGAVPLREPLDGQPDPVGDANTSPLHQKGSCPVIGLPGFLKIQYHWSRCRDPARNIREILSDRARKSRCDPVNGGRLSLCRGDSQGNCQNRPQNGPFRRDTHAQSSLGQP